MPAPSIIKGTTMEYYAGIDVSLESSSLCVVDATGRIVREAKVASEPETLTGQAHPGLLVTRSLTKHWSIPGVRAGYVLGPAPVIDALRRQQSPWAVSTTAAAAIRACSTDAALAEADRRAHTIVGWRRVLTDGLDDLGVPYVPSSTSFVLAQVGTGVREALRRAGIAVRRADTFPGLDDTWTRIAVRPEEPTHELVQTLRAVLDNAAN